MIFSACALDYFNTAFAARVTRSAMREDYVRTARSKGLRKLLVIARHALKNAFLSVISDNMRFLTPSRHHCAITLLTLAAVVTTVTAAACTGTTPTSQGPPSEQQQSPTSTVVATPTSGIQATATPKPGAWRTNLNKYVVDPKVVGPGLPRDSIPPIYEPKFESISEADTWLDDEDLAGVMSIGDHTKIYPYPVLFWHEVVNDSIGGTPVLVTYCPLCATVIAFDRRVGGEELVFGVSGKLRHENLIMWDHQTESWWQQLTGEALVGDLAGEKLDFLPLRTLPWGEVLKNIDDAPVLSRESTQDERLSGFYTIKPCPTEYPDEGLLWTGGPTSEALGSHARVVGLSNPKAVAYPISELARLGVVNDTIGIQPVVLIYSAKPCIDTVLGLGAEIVDAAAAFAPVVDGRTLSFYFEGGRILDRDTGSAWSPAGLSVEGPLEGFQLEALPHTISFWAPWVAFHPETELRLLPANE